MNLQTRYDLAVAERDHGARIAAEVTAAPLIPGRKSPRIFGGVSAVGSGRGCC